MKTDIAQNRFSNFMDYNSSNFFFGEGDDVYHTIHTFNEWWKVAYPGGYHIYKEPFISAPGTTVSIRNNLGKQLDGLLNLSSFNYLGMSSASVVAEEAIKAILHYGIGACGEPNLSGTYDIHRSLESAVANFKRKEACLTFTSGYSANLGIISGIMRPGDSVFLDQYSHSSIVDGATLSKANIIFFRHNRADDLDRKLKGVKGRKLVVVEGIYSMDGDFCNLPEIVEVSKQHGARILIDEAHSSFICGETGRGIVEHFGLEDEVDFQMGTFSKALGCLGGYVCGDKAFITYLEAYARSCFFSTTMPPCISAATLASLRYAIANPQIRKQLWDNVKYLQRCFQEEGIDFGNSTSQVMPIMVGNDSKVYAIANRFREEGIFLQPVTYPAVSKGKARFRLSVSADHTTEQLDFATRTIVKVLDEVGIKRMQKIH